MIYVYNSCPYIFFAGVQFTIQAFTNALYKTLGGLRFLTNTAHAIFKVDVSGGF
jgi:hypothetical protein